jgi:hypothetical protein
LVYFRGLWFGFWCLGFTFRILCKGGGTRILDVRGWTFEVVYKVGGTFCTRMVGWWDKCRGTQNGEKRGSCFQVERSNPTPYSGLTLHLTQV